MKLAEFSVKNSLFVNLLSVFLLCAGAVSLFQLRREAFPEVSFDKVTVSTVYSGATAEEIERLVTIPIENELKEVDDIDEMNSVSREGVSTIVLTINPDVRDKRKVIDDIQAAVDRVTDLPDDAEEPVVVEITSKNIPVIIVSLSGNLSESKLQELADNLRDKFLDIPGVASVKRRGWRDREFWVETDLFKMKEYHVSFDEIMSAIAGKNVGLPAGQIETASEVFDVKTSGEFYTKEEIEDTLIRSNDAGVALRVKDIAEVKDTFEEENVINKVEGTRAISLVVVKKEKGDAIKVVDTIKKIIDEFKKGAPAELNINTFYDLSYYIKRRLNVLRSNGTIGIILVLACLFIFLHRTPAILTALGIPVAMFATFWVMNLSGMSINLITMFGLIVVLGMLVDDGIIIAENIYRYVEEGMPPREAAVKGASEVMKPVLTTVLTTIAAFSPLMFMSGLLGKFVRNIPIVVCIALTASLIEAFIILPSHMADFVKVHKTKGGIKRPNWLSWVIDKYVVLLSAALRFRYLVLLLVLGLFASAVFLAVRVMPFVLFSVRGVEQFMIRAEAEVGTPLDKMEELIRPVEELVASIPREYMDTYETQIGNMEEERGFDPAAKQASHVAQITVYLTPLQSRDKDAKQIIEEYRPALEKIGGFKKLYFREFKEGPPTGRPIDVKIRGEKYEIINEIASKVKAYIASLKGVRDIIDSYELGNKQLHIVVDTEKAAKSYINVDDVARSLRIAFEGGIATSIKPIKAEEEINVRVRLNESFRNRKDIFDHLLIENRFGNLVPLKSIAHIEERQGLRFISHLDGKRIVSINAEVDNKNITSAKANSLIKNKFKNIASEYPGYTIRYGGEEEETQKSMHSLLSAAFLALFLIFLILATLFNSLIQPFVVMAVIPLSLIGVVFALYLHGEPIGFLVYLGLVGLAGIVVNDSIVMMDFINNLRRQKIPRRQSIIEAGRLRFRPVVLTTITTVAGISTVAYGIGGFDPFLRPMALTIAWGLIAGTALTLIVIPCIYAIVDDLTIKIAHHATVKNSNNSN